MKEVFKDIVGYEGLYQVSNIGRVKSLPKDKVLHNCGFICKSKERILKPKLEKNGYLRVGLYKNGIVQYFSIHRLVAIAFIENPNNYPDINHKDENRTNNNVNNLEWCSVSYNTQYSSYKWTGEKHWASKKVLCIETGESFFSITEAGKQKNVQYKNIHKCCKGERHTAGEFHWQYCA